MSLWSRWFGWCKRGCKTARTVPAAGPPLATNPPAPALSRGEATPVISTSPAPIPPRPATEFRASPSDAIDVVQAVREHLHQQAHRSERLLETLQGLPQAIQTLPETNRNQSRMLEVLQLHLDQQGKQASKLHDVLATLAHANETSTQMMGLMQQHVESNREHNERFIQSFASMGEILQRIGDSSHASLQTLRDLSNQSDRRLQELVDRSNRHARMLSITSWITAAIALALAAYVALKIH